MFPAVFGIFHCSKSSALQATLLCPHISVKKLFYHAHGQSLSKPPGAGNKSYLIILFPPFLNKSRFVNIKTIFLPKIFKILLPYSHRSGHVFTSFPPLRSFLYMILIYAEESLIHYYPYNKIKYSINL